MHNLDVPSSGPLVEAPSSFVGRVRELHELRAVLARARLVTLTGPGGCGKTRLALRAAAGADGELGEVVTVDLAALSSLEHPAEALLRTLEAPAAAGADPMRAALRVVGDDPHLIVLDNCEHVLDATRELVEALERARPATRVLATSREPLRAQGELVWPVPPLSLGADSDAVALFRERAGATPGGANADPRVVERICAALDGLPLAIELTAARCRVMTVEEIAAEIGSSLRMVGAAVGPVPERQRTIRASIQWSWSHLREPERRLLRRLAVFEGGFFTDGAQAVDPDSGSDPAAVLDVLSTLVEKSLVQAEPHGQRMRFRLLEVVRQFASEQLAAAGELEATRERHLDHFVSVAERAAEMDPAGSVAGQGQLGLEFANLRAAVSHATSVGDERGLRILVACSWFIRQSGRAREARGLLDRALEATADRPSGIRARALADAGILAIIGGEYERTAELCQEAVELGERTGEPRAVASGLTRLAAVTPDVEQATALVQRAVAVAREAGDSFALSDALPMVVVGLSVTDDMAAIEPFLVELEEVSAASRNGVSAAYAIWERCRQRMCAGDPAALHDEAEKLLAVALDAREPIMRVCAFQALATAGAQSGSGAAWRERLLDELAVAQEEGAVGVVAAELGLCWIALADGDVRALRRHAGSIHERGARTHRYYQWSATWMLMQAALLDGQPKLAAGLASELEELGRELQNARVVGLAKTGQARCALLGGDDGRAEQLAQQALEGLTAQPWLADRADVLELLGAIAAHQRRFERAVRLLAAVNAWRAARSLERVPRAAAFWDGLLAEAPRALGGDGFARCRQEGAALSLEEAVALARRHRGRRDRALAGFASLTRAEQQVAELAAQGLTNPEIGERLFITRGTVKVHLTRVYGKLGVANRTQLARLWRDAPDSRVA
jgi:predicted ATPase/DNA-binding CsgD family transcriptional regulator